MNVEQLMDALSNVDERYIQEAAPGGNRPAGRRLRYLAAVAAVAAALTFFQTAPGAAALEHVKETAAGLIETLFPSKDITLQIEGEAETQPHEAGGQIPEASVPGFAIYYDTERYRMTNEEGVFYIHPIVDLPSREALRADNEALLTGLTDEETETMLDTLLAERETLYEALPVCELEIRRLPCVQPGEAAQESREEAVTAWDSVTDVMDSVEPVGWMFRMADGADWDAHREQRWFVGDGQGGTFQLSVRYFQEAEEGHGARLLQMLSTFEVLAP